MGGWPLSLAVATSLLAGCATEPSPRLPSAAGEAPGSGPGDAAMVAGGLATGALIALIAVAAIAGTATVVFVSDP